MNSPIVNCTESVALVGGATLTLQHLNTLQRLAHCFVAADGGANHLHHFGLQPKAVIGDLDSISAVARAAFADVLFLVTEQDTTDFEKAVTRIDAPLIVGAGFLGGRIDHTLSVFNVLARHAAKRIVLMSDDDVCFLLPPTGLRMTLQKGTRIALMPLAQCRVTSSGLRWDLKNQDMHPTGIVSSSNAVERESVTISSNGALLITLPLSALDSAIDAVPGQ